jgi:hypothetical protein
MVGRSVAHGYGGAHQRKRAQWAKKVERGEVNCWRCGRWIAPGSAWDLGHDDWDRRIYRGAEHASCNRGWWRNRYRASRQSRGQVREW